MFEIFYPKNRARSSLSPTAMKTLLQYRRQPASGPKISALLQGGNLHLIAISYAHGCCTKSLKTKSWTSLEGRCRWSTILWERTFGPRMASCQFQSAFAEERWRPGNNGNILLLRHSPDFRCCQFLPVQLGSSSRNTKEPKEKEQ